MATISEKYRKLEQREHVLARPALYIGSVEPDTVETWVWDGGAIAKKSVSFVPGLYKIFDELLVNAIDHSVRLGTQQAAATASGAEQTVDYPVKNVKVVIERDTGYIEVWNDGDGIDVALHPEHGVHVPELIFGHMLTSTNYDDDAERVIGGQNGIGAKACNIFSKVFTVSTVDHRRGKLYVQTFRDNMSVVEPPKITACKRGPYTSVRFLPDYERFGACGGKLTDDMYAMIVKRVHDACAVTAPTVNVHFNGDRIACKSFERYVDMYIGAKADAERIYECSGQWEVVAAPSGTGFEHVSFVNGICTFKGGKHVDSVVAAIVKNLSELIEKRKQCTVKPSHVKDALMVFIKATIVNPTFDSQSKECLTTPASKFGSKCELSDKFYEKLYKSDITARVLSRTQDQAAKEAKKTDGRKSNRIRGMHKLEDANLAGTSRSKECALILSEGESAKSLCVSGFSVVGRDLYGVYPLRGKMLNVKDVSAAKVLENQEVQDLKKILGLESGKAYTRLEDLRYGRLILMTDQDKDGAHCKGLIMNVFHTLWPSLAKIPGFMTSLLTPIIKVSKNAEQHSFYNERDFELWRESVAGGAAGWRIKYYKGLGTSTDEEAKEYFSDMRIVGYDFKSEECDKCIDLAFNKKRADDRKRWLGQYDEGDVLSGGCACFEVVRVFCFLFGMGVANFEGGNTAAMEHMGEGRRLVVQGERVDGEVVPLPPGKGMDREFLERHFCRVPVDVKRLARLGAFEVRAWVERCRKSWLTIGDVLKLKPGDKIKVLVLDSDMIDVVRGANNRGTAYNPVRFFKKNTAIFRRDDDVSRSRPHNGLSGTIRWVDDDVPFEFEVEFNNSWRPFRDGYVGRWPGLVPRVFGKTHWTSFPKTTHIGWRGPMMAWSRVAKMPKVYWS